MSGCLIVDIGSTHAAWRLGDVSGRAPHHGCPGSIVISRVDERPDRVVAGGVAVPLVLREFADAVGAHWGMPPDMLSATASAYGVRNGYRRPESLGIDRWAAIVAAFVRFGGPVLVADCGTALTVDCVDADGGHHGGWITPGLGLLREALARGTRLEVVPSAAALTGERVFGKDTEEAVAMGCINALAGALERASREASRDCGAQGRLVLTGGDAELVADRLSADWQIVPQLVLDGLELLDRGRE